jgi:hypothetical protein
MKAIRQGGTRPKGSSLGMTVAMSRWIIFRSSGLSMVIGCPMDPSPGLSPILKGAVALIAGAGAPTGAGGVTDGGIGAAALTDKLVDCSWLLKFTLKI